jgi:hypothetical protein
LWVLGFTSREPEHFKHSRRSVAFRKPALKVEWPDASPLPIFAAAFVVRVEDNIFHTQHVSDVKARRQLNRVWRPDRPNASLRMVGMARVNRPGVVKLSSGAENDWVWIYRFKRCA